MLYPPTWFPFTVFCIANSKYSRADSGNSVWIATPIGGLEDFHRPVGSKNEDSVGGLEGFVP